MNNNKILLTVNSALINSTGGVEHVLCNMANEMHKRGFDVFIATMENKEGKPFFPLNNEIKFKNLYKDIPTQNKLISKLFSFYLKLKGKKDLKELYTKSKTWNKYIESIKPDLIICFSLPTLLDITYIKKPKIPIILTVHGNPINDYTNRFWPRPEYMNKLFRKTYQNTDVIQVLLDSYQSFVPKEYKGEVATIGNVAPFALKKPLSLDQENHKITSIGRLCFEKHQDLLIKAFSKISSKFPDWTIDIYGEGPLKQDYQNLINELKMTKKIHLKGTIQNPSSILKKTDIFALPSRVEGFPLVLAEAMGMGLPCIGLDCCDGTNEIIKNGKNGLLCRDDDELAKTLGILIKNKKLRKQYGKSAFKSMQEYSAPRIWNQWEKLIKKTIDKKRK